MAPKPTTELLKKLRWHMLNSKYLQDAIQAYIIPSDDAHQVEWTTDRIYRYFTFIHVHASLTERVHSGL